MGEIASIGIALMAQEELRKMFEALQTKYKLSRQEMLDLIEISYHRFLNES
jgi:hypothetical protein